MATIEARLQALESKHAEPLNMMIIILDGDKPTEDQQRQIDEGERIGQKVMVVSFVSPTAKQIN
jgi:hypothetical protein